EWMPDCEALGMLHVGLQARRQQAGRRRAEYDLRASRTARRGQQGALDLLSLGSAFLDEIDPRDRLLDARRERQLPLGRKRREREPAVGAASVAEHRVDLPGGLRARMAEPHG